MILSIHQNKFDLDYWGMSNKFILNKILEINNNKPLKVTTISFTNLNAGIYNILTNHIGRCNLQVQDIIIVEPQEVIANFQNINDTIFLDSSGSATIDFNNVSNG